MIEFWKKIRVLVDFVGPMEKVIQLLGLESKSQNSTKRISSDVKCTLFYFYCKGLTSKNLVLCKLGVLIFISV
jgi:hypothetical protein